MARRPLGFQSLGIMVARPWTPRCLTRDARLGQAAGGLVEVVVAG
jgi:hypothetical protein